MNYLIFKHCMVQIKIKIMNIEDYDSLYIKLYNFYINNYKILYKIYKKKVLYEFNGINRIKYEMV